MNGKKDSIPQRQNLSVSDTEAIVNDMFNLFESHYLGVRPALQVVINFILRFSEGLGDQVVLSDEKGNIMTFVEILLRELPRGLKELRTFNTKQSEKSKGGERNGLE